MVASSKRLEEDDARYERSGEAYGLQLRSLAYDETVGEVWYAAKFYERAMRNVRLIVQARDPANPNDWKESLEPRPNELLRTLQDKNGETSALLGRYGRLTFLTGDVRMFGQVDGQGYTSWEMLSVQEIRINDQGQYIRKVHPSAPDEVIERAPSDVFTPTPGGAVMFRLWTPSPRFSEMADWPLRASLDICEELLLLTRRVRGEIRSRLAGNGLLYIPQEIILAMTEIGRNPDEDPVAPDIMAKLMQAMETAIQQDNAASALVPIVVTGPGDLGAYIKHFTFEKPESQDEAKRNECIRRLALSLDMPPEALLGIGDTNHWGAWQIDESAWKVHIEPVTKTLVENLTSAWFRPMLGTSDYRIWYDESAVVNHPDRSKDFKEANEAYIVSNKSYRREIGATEDDAMSPEEQNRMAELKALAHRGSEATTTPPANSTGSGPSEITVGPPAGDPQAAPSRDASPTGAPEAAKLLAAAELAVWRGRELAGSRLRSKVHREKFRSVPNLQLAAACRGETTDADPDALVAGCGAMLHHMLTVWRVPADLTASIVTACEEHTRDTLFEQDPMPLPDDLVKLCTVGSLGGDA